ncbi:MAG: pacearchaeosortase [Candidatus Pacearchaeota archaeon]
MNKKVGELKNIIVRYFSLIALSFNSLFVFYLIFTPLTIYFSYFLLDYIFGATLDYQNAVIFTGIDSVPVEIIKACIAGSAYYLLLIFNLTTPNIVLRKRLKMISFAFLAFFLANVIRIVVLTAMYISGSAFFDVTHQATWYFGSVVLVIAIWFYQVKRYNIKSIPFYSDIKFLYEHSLLKKRK